ncbi:hypothetical protein E2C01_028068 [Portunus trituberculatus]|uniref:MADF domain-containing protein n=1 Tax=Portunus trituberculatus TaxID=210409 RepID=A0A5B7EJJ9_PORTR|nr:hypothetical protein [Portunus trituberculatus]
MEGKQHLRWTCLSEEFLVENIRNHKYLWDHTNSSYLKKGLKRASYNTITYALRDSFPELGNITAAEPNVAVDTFSIIIHEDGTQEVSIVSPSSSSTPSLLYSYTSLPSPCTISLPSSL